MRRTGAANHPHVVVVSLKYHLPVEIELLHLPVDGEARRLVECGLQNPPRFARLMVWIKFPRLDAFPDQHEWEVDVLPQGVAGEIDQMEIVPRRVSDMSLEGRARLVAELDDLALAVLLPHAIRREDQGLVRVLCQSTVCDTLFSCRDESRRDPVPRHALSSECLAEQIESDFDGLDFRPFLEATVSLENKVRECGSWSYVLDSRLKLEPRVNTIYLGSVVGIVQCYQFVDKLCSKLSFPRFERKYRLALFDETLSSLDMYRIGVPSLITYSTVHLILAPRLHRTL